MNEALCLRRCFNLRSDVLGLIIRWSTALLHSHIAQRAFCNLHGMRPLWTTASAALALAFAHPSAASVPILTAPRAALVIGNGDYTSASSLRNPVNDAQDMCSSLRDIGYQTFCFTNITTRAQFRSIVQDFADKLSPNTVSLVYYAGHAVQISGENYLIPTGAQVQTPQTAAEQSMRLGYVMKQLQAARNVLKILIVDACRDELTQASPAFPSANLTQISITSFPDDSFVLYSTATNEAALDGQGRNGLLTKNLLAHLRDTGDLNDLFNHVADGVRADAAAIGYPQVPEIRRNSTLRFCFVRCTELQELQAKEERAAQEIARLQLSVAAGDRDAKALLASQLKYQAELKKKDEQIAQKAKERLMQASVPPAY